MVAGPAFCDVNKVQFSAEDCGNDVQELDE